MVVQLIPLVVGKLNVRGGGGAENAAPADPAAASNRRCAGWLAWLLCSTAAVPEQTCSLLAALLTACCSLHLQETLHINTAGSMEAAERQSEIQGLLCGMTQVIVQKLSDNDSAKAGVLQVRQGWAVAAAWPGRNCCRLPADAAAAVGSLLLPRPLCCCSSVAWPCAIRCTSIKPATHALSCPQYADHIMDALLNVFACRKNSVHEEAMLAVVSAGGLVMAGACCGAPVKSLSATQFGRLPCWAAALCMQPSTLHTA